MKIVLIFVIVMFVIGIQYGYAEEKNILTVRYFDNYDAPYELEIDSNQNYIASQSYSWVRDQSSRYNLIGYSIDGNDVVEISRKARGNFTLDIAMDVPHSIVFFAVPQFPLLVTGLIDYKFNPKSPTDDNWFDSNTSVRVEFPSILQNSETVVIDSPKTITARWNIDYTAVVAIILSVITACVTIIYIKKRSRIKEAQKKTISEKGVIDQKLIHDDQYDSDIGKLLETKALEELESYFVNGLIDEEKYLRIKNNLATTNAKQ